MINPIDEMFAAVSSTEEIVPEISSEETVTQPAVTPKNNKTSYVSDQFTSFLKMLNLMSPYGSDLIFDKGFCGFLTENKTTCISLKMPIDISIILGVVKKKAKMLALLEGDVVTIEETDRVYKITDNILSLELVKANSTITQNFTASEFDEKVKSIKENNTPLLDKISIIEKQNIISKSLSAFECNIITFRKDKDSNKMNIEIQDINTINIMSLDLATDKKDAFEMSTIADFVSLPFTELYLSLYDISENKNLSEFGIIWEGTIGETDVTLISRASSSSGESIF